MNRPFSTGFKKMALVLAFASSTALAHKGADSFKECDTDNDGRVTSAEHETVASSKFTKADANGDGSITQQEMMESSKSMFTKMDGNADGALTMEEMKDGHMKMDK